ncbi:MAG: DUF4275 family protein [Eubacteriales bacterium]
MKSEHLLKSLGVAYTKLIEEQIVEHKRAWIQTFLYRLKKQQKMAAEIYCLPSDDGYSDYLWHAFSYELLIGSYGVEAKIALQNIENSGSHSLVKLG